MCLVLAFYFVVEVQAGHFSRPNRQEQQRQLQRKGERGVWSLQSFGGGGCLKMVEPTMDLVSLWFPCNNKRGSPRQSHKLKLGATPCLDMLNHYSGKTSDRYVTDGLGLRLRCPQSGFYPGSGFFHRGLLLGSEL